MNVEDEYDERSWLQRYVISNCRDLMTREELEALYVSNLEAKADASSSRGVKYWFEGKLRELRDIENELIGLDQNELEQRILDRVLRENPEVINRCPSCRKVARTPSAKQCPWCFCDWR